MLAATVALAAGSASASFTRPRAATASFTATSIVAPVVTSAVRCTVSGVLTVNWTPSTSTFVTGQVVAYSSASLFGTLTGSKTINDRTTSSTTFNTSLGTWYVRVTATYQSWTAASTVVQASAALC